VGMKPIHGDGSEPIASSLAPNLVNHANSHQSGKWGKVAPNTVSQPEYEGNQPKPFPSNLVSHAQKEFVAAEEPDHSGGKG
jgi:hypothetical protein